MNLAGFNLITKVIHTGSEDVDELSLRYDVRMWKLGMEMMCCVTTGTSLVLHCCCIFTGEAAVSLVLGGRDAGRWVGTGESATPRSLFVCVSNELACGDSKS